MFFLKLLYDSLLRVKLKVYLEIIILHIFIYILIKLVFLHFLSKGSTEYPIIVWWTNFMPDGYRQTNCQHNYDCIISGDRNISQDSVKAYLFYGSRIENEDFPLPRSSNVLWAIYHEESPKNYAPFLYKEVQTLFNITATFSRLSHFPLTLNYLEDIDLLTDQTFFRSVENKNTLLKELAPVLYVQSDCDTPINRDNIVEDLMKYIPIDSYGHCLNNKHFPEELEKINSLDLYNEAYLKFVAKYKFTIAIENAVCDDYITEKLWRPLIVGSVPIYLGSNGVENWLPNNSSAILVKNFTNIKALAEYIKEVNENDTLYNMFLEHKLKRKITNNFLQENLIPKYKDYHSVTGFECFVCQKIHEIDKEVVKQPDKNVYDCVKPSGRTNTWDQHWDVGKCQAKTLRALVERNVPYTSEEFETQWNLLFKNKNC